MDIIAATLQYVLVGVFILIFVKYSGKIQSWLGRGSRKLASKDLWTAIKAFLVAYLLIFVIFIPLARLIVLQISVLITAGAGQ